MTEKEIKDKAIKDLKKALDNTKDDKVKKAIEKKLEYVNKPFTK